MPKSNNRGWLTGGNADFENYIGLCMKIPNNPYMIRAFWGAMLMLGESWNYQYEGGTEARDTANVWKAVTAENMLQLDLNEDCTMALLDAYIDNCIIYFKQGGEYVPLLDISSCVDGRIRAANSGGGGNDTTIWNDIYAPVDPAHPTDDLDCVWGGVKSLVTYLWTKLDEWLNIIEAAANASEAIAEIFEVDGVPVYAPLDLFLDFVNSVLDFTVVVVRASYNTDTLEDLMCELFCLIVENSNILDTTVKESFLTANTLSLNPTRAALGALAYTYSGATWRKYYLLGTNNCENDWEILCEECGEPDTFNHHSDFSASDDGWIVDPSPALGAIYELGNGWHQQLVSGVTGTYIQRSIDPRTVTKVTMTYNAALPVTLAKIILQNGVTTVDSISEPVVVGIGNTLVIEGIFENVDTIRCQVGNSTGSAGGTSVITDIVTEGLDVDPF